MKIIGIRDNCDGKGPQKVETEGPDLTPDQIAENRAYRQARLNAAKESKPK